MLSHWRLRCRPMTFVGTPNLQSIIAPEPSKAVMWPSPGEGPCHDASLTAFLESAKMPESGTRSWPVLSLMRPFSKLSPKGPFSRPSSVPRERTGQPLSTQSLSSRQESQGRGVPSRHLWPLAGWCRPSPSHCFGLGLSVPPAGLLRTQVMFPLPQD